MGGKPKPKYEKKKQRQQPSGDRRPVLATPRAPAPGK